MGRLSVPSIFPEKRGIGNMASGLDETDIKTKAAGGGLLKTNCVWDEPFSEAVYDG